MNENYETYELVLKDDEDEVFALSLVSEPAIQQDFVYFGLDDKEVIKFASVDTDKHTIVGPILIPNIKILRLKEDGTPYYVTFSKDTVQKLAQKYIKDNNSNNITLEHQTPVKGISLVESWIAESSKYDKAKAYGLNVKPGTWMGVFDLSGNIKVWNEFIKTGKLKGISLEGLFTHELMKASKIEDIFEKDITELSEIEAELLLGYIKNTIKKDKRYSKGQTMLEESHSDYGSAIKSNAKKALAWAEEHGWGSCGTPVGKQRANQLAKGEPISVDTIKRMHSFLSRHEGDLQSSKSYSDGCGKLMYDAWGGKAGLRWSRNKLKKLGLLEAEAQPSIASSYPGEGPDKKKKDYIHPALIGTKK